MMEHWRAALPDRIIDVAYEDVVEDVESEARKLLDRMELPWDPASSISTITRRSR